MRRAWGEALMSIGTVAVILLVLVAVDDRVRDQFSMRFTASRPSVGLATAGQQARDLTSVIAEVARDQSLAHAPLLIFSLAAVVLVLFMLRT
jgi:hypothetical protein